jgi:hypothetical protein
MAQIIKKNEKVVAPFFKNGVTLDYYTITFPSDVSGKLGAATTTVNGVVVTDRSPVAAAIEAIQARTSIEIIGTLANTGTTLNVAIASLGGAYATDDYNKNGSPVTFVTFLDTAVKAAKGAAGDHVFQSVNLASASVTAGSF